MGVNKGETPGLGQEGLLPGASPGVAQVECMKPICLFLALAFGGKSTAWLIGAPGQGYQEHQPL